MTTKATILRAIHANCIDCAGGSPVEVRRCALRTCQLWEFRLGRDPQPSRCGNACRFVKTTSQEHANAPPAGRRG